MKYTYGPTGYTTADRDTFIAHLKERDGDEKKAILMQFWKALYIEDSCDGDCLWAISADVVEWGGALFDVWANALINDMETQCDAEDRAVTREDIRVEYTEED